MSLCEYFWVRGMEGSEGWKDVYLCVTILGNVV